MKVLRKGDEFVKVNDQTIEDLIKINSMTERVWAYAAKKDYKDAFKVEKTATEVKAETKKESKNEIKSEKKELRKDTRQKDRNLKKKKK